MKTVFKVGMTVYDQVNFPDEEGVVIKIDSFPCPIIVEFDKEKYSYRLDGSFQFGAKPTLSTKPYEVEFKGFEQKAPIPTFEEAWKKTMRLYEPKSEYNKEEYKGYPSQELADASEALRRLLFLRDYYNDGWQPDWEEDEWKYFIENYRGKLNVRRTYNNGRVLHFKTPEIRDKFLEEQRELLEIAKPLL